MNTPQTESIAKEGTPASLLDDRSYSIREFCLAEGISPVRYYKMRKDGYGPRELRFPGSSVIRITHAARLEWHRRIEEMNRAEQARLDQERAARRAKTSKAGRKGAASPHHHSRRNARRARR